MPNYRAPGKGGGLIVQMLSSSQTVYVPHSTLRISHDPRLGEDTESDDIGSHFSPSGAMVPGAEIVLHRRDSGYPEFIGLVPGQQIFRIWLILGAVLVGGTPSQKSHLLINSTVAVMDDDIQEISPNMPITIRLQGGYLARHGNLPALNTVIAATPLIPSGF